VTAGLPHSGVPLARLQRVVVTSGSVAEMRPVTVPVEFERAVRSLADVSLRPEVRVEELRPPQRLAPRTYALSLEVVQGRDLLGTGRLVLLHDPEGYHAWRGTLRLVGYATVDLDSDMARDPLLAHVGWSWLLDALATSEAGHTAASGTITQTTSTRFGAAAQTPASPHRGDVEPAWRSSAEFELRASWTPLGTDLSAHLRAFADLLCTAAGLPPPGVAALPGSAG
jgi:Protein of unknown function (DUF3000)